MTTIALPASAAVCQGPITVVGMEPDGMLAVNYGFGMHTLCGVSGNVTVYRGANNSSPITIAASACQALYAAIQTAKASGKQMRTHVNRPDCNMGDWTIPNPYPYFWEFPS